MTTMETVSLINRLTTDSDERQELWVHYLENSDIAALSNHLARIRKAFSEEDLLQITLWKQTKNPSDSKLLDLFEHFTALEQSVMRLLALGATLQDISGIKIISVARLRHIISVIHEQEVWKHYGA